MGKKYPAKKYVNVGLIVSGVALFMYSGAGAGKEGTGTTDQVRQARDQVDVGRRRSEDVEAFFVFSLGSVGPRSWWEFSMRASRGLPAWPAQDPIRLALRGRARLDTP